MINEQGAARFTFRVIRTFDSEDEALAFEDSLIRKFREHHDPNVRSRLINSCKAKGVGRRAGFEVSAETRLRMKRTRLKNQLKEAYDRLNGNDPH